ncbi:tetratricopeptide repeat protein [Candidatus Aerophobetes bacterium]|nr:tetratricopeptide repeat protein [Candidatus Aerophobetes bacterium]
MKMKISLLSLHNFFLRIIKIFSSGKLFLVKFIKFIPGLLSVKDFFKKTKRIILKKTKISLGILFLLLIAIFTMFEVSPPLLNKESKLENYLQKAENLYKEKRYNEGRKIYEKIIEEFPQRKEKIDLAYYRVGEGLQKCELFHQSITIYEKFIQQYPHSDYLLKAKYNLSSCYKKIGRIEKAEQILKEIINESPRNEMMPEVYFLLADCLREQNKNKEAVPIYQKVIREYPASLQAERSYLRLGDIYLQKKRYSEAMLCYSSLLKEYPRTILRDKALFKLALSSFSQKEVDKTISLLLTILDEYPRSDFLDESFFLLGECFCQKKEYEKVLIIFQKMEKIYEDNPLVLTKAKRKIAELYLNEKKYTEAAKIYENIIKNYAYYCEGEDKIYFELGSLYQKIGSDDKAKKTLMNFIQYFPLSPEISSAYFKLGEIFFKQGFYLESIKAFQEAIEEKLSKEKTGKALSKIGEGYMRLGLWNEALNTFEKSLCYLNERENLRMQFKIEECLLRKRDTSAAKKFSSSLLKKPFTNYPFSEEYLKIGDILNIYGEKRIALEMYKKALLNLPPEGEKFYFTLYKIGNIQKNVGLINQAFKTYKGIIYLTKKDKLFSKNKIRKDALLSLADLYYSLKKYENASLLYTQIATDFPENKDISWVLYQIGNCYQHLGLPNKARTFYQELIKNFGDNLWAQIAKTIMM